MTEDKKDEDKKVEEKSSLSVLPPPPPEDDLPPLPPPVSSVPPSPPPEPEGVEREEKKEKPLINPKTVVHILRKELSTEPVPESPKEPEPKEPESKEPEPKESESKEPESKEPEPDNSKENIIETPPPQSPSEENPLASSSPVGNPLAESAPPSLQSQMQNQMYPTTSHFFSRNKSIRRIRKESSFNRSRSNSLVHSSHKGKKYGTFHALPHGWYEGFDSQGRKYYLHRRTKVTQWDVPNEILQYLPPLPPDWSERKDPCGKAFYVNVKLRKSQRARPGPHDAELLEAATGVTPQTVQAPAIPPSPLGKGIRERKASYGNKLSVDVRPSAPIADIVVTPPPNSKMESKVESKMESDESLIQKYRVPIRTDDLKEGWKVVLNKKKRRIFFYNAEQKLSSWDVPTTENLPEGWIARVDFDTQRRYYVNSSTNQVQWRLPTDSN